MRRHVLLLALASLAGCSGAPLPHEADRRARTWFALDQAPTRPPVIAIWYARGVPGPLACGVAEAVGQLREHRRTIRWVYYLGLGTGQVEMHELVGSDLIGDVLIANNRMIFDAMWKENCAPFAPAGRRVAALLGG